MRTPCQKIFTRLTIHGTFSTFHCKDDAYFSYPEVHMKRTINQRLCIISILTVALTTQLAMAETPEGQDELRIYTGAPKTNGESFVSISGRWMTSDELQSGFTALTFVNGPDRPKPDSAASMARKIAKSVKRGMAYLRTSLRGITANATKDTEKPQYVIKNKKGISLSSIIIRDFSSEKFTAEIGAKSFSSHGVQIGWDFAEAASIAQAPVNYSGPGKTFRAGGGGIEISIGDEKPVKIDTANKTTEQIEKSIAAKLGGKFSSSSLFPVTTEKRDRKNIKPFDGGEVHLKGISAKSFTINVKDTSIGIITKYKFRESAKKSSWF